MASRIPSIAETSRDPGFPLAGLHISLLPAARVIVTEVSQLASDNRGGESVGFARRTWGVTPWGLRLHVVFEQDQQVTDGGRVELAGGDLDRRGGDGSPAMSGLGRLVLGSVVWLWAPDTVSARPFRVDPVRWRCGAQQDIDGDGGRYRVRSSADASWRAVRALWRAPRSVLGCAAVCGGGQDEFHCGGQVRPPAGVDDVRMGACSGPHPVRDDPLRIGSTLRAHGCRLATSLRRARGRWGMPTVGRSRRRRSRALWPTRRAGQWSRPAASASRTLGSI